MIDYLDRPGDTVRVGCDRDVGEGGGSEEGENAKENEENDAPALIGNLVGDGPVSTGKRHG